MSIKELAGFIIEIGALDEFGYDWYVWKEGFMSYEEAEKVMLEDREKMKVKPLMRVRQFQSKAQVV